ncbi:MAG: hypothetical protein ABI981_05635 [Betaproteobacteria bacterium]
MKPVQQIRRAISVAILATAAGVPAASMAQAPSAFDASRWQFTATLYGYFPSIGGKLAFPVDTGGSSINVNADKVIDSLKFAFMGTLDANNGRWGMFTDLIYLDLGGSKSRVRDFSIGNIGLPATTTADLNLNLKGTLWTVAGEYRVISDPSLKVDVLAGARLFDIKPTLGYSIYGDLGPIREAGRSGSSSVKEDFWDGIVGLKGRYAFGDRREWFIPFYADVGTGQSDLTWQVAAGVGYSYNWGSVFAMWRYLDYNFKSSSRIDNINFNGPMLGVAFQW